MRRVQLLQTRSAAAVIVELKISTTAFSTLMARSLLGVLLVANCLKLGLHTVIIQALSSAHVIPAPTNDPEFAAAAYCCKPGFSMSWICCLCKPADNYLTGLFVGLRLPLQSVPAWIRKFSAAEGQRPTGWTYPADSIQISTRLRTWCLPFRDSLNGGSNFASVFGLYHSVKLQLSTPGTPKPLKIAASLNPQPQTP